MKNTFLVLLATILLAGNGKAQRPSFQPQRPTPIRRPLDPLNRPVRQPQNSIALAPVNRPYLLEGSDLNRFEIREDTPVGTEVYTLKGLDPSAERGNGKILYTISGDHFSVDLNTGVIKLKEALDREVNDIIDVVVTIQDENYQNIVPFRRRIKVLDVNDNRPEFQGLPYRFSIKETVAVGEILYTGIAIRDLDTGLNGIVKVTCDEVKSPEACETFEIDIRESSGSFIGIVKLKKELDFETRSSYDMAIIATDSGLTPGPLSSSGTIEIDVLDIQDQPPTFLNAPYSATVQENVEPGESIFDIRVRDGDTGNPREIELGIIGDKEGFFTLNNKDYNPETGILSAKLIKAPGNTFDRELPSLLADGGLYSFQIRATEIFRPEDESELALTSSEDISAVANVTIVVTDVDDQVPTFNVEDITVAVPEDVGVHTPLPDLNIVVNDGDTAVNAEYNLVLEGADGVFEVLPNFAVGRTPVIVRVSDPTKLNYESEDGRNFEFQILAVKDEVVMSSAIIKVIVIDSNDNVPVFDQERYVFSVNENSRTGAFVGKIAATDKDSGRFGQVEYNLRGFGAEKFEINPETGEILVNGCGRQLLRSSCLDYETQKSYSLIVSATDGGGQVSTTGLTIFVSDVNDNFPKFESKIYLRTIEEGAHFFDPPLIIQATDEDGPAQGDGKVFYSIKSINTDETVFEIDPISGELTMIKPARAEYVADGQFSIVIRATDGGDPPLHNDVQVSVNVGTVTNAKPIFSKEEYEATVKEDAKAGTPVAKVEARDPDGSDSQLRFSLHSGTKDNFVIDSVSGIVSVSKDSVLDIQENGDTYNIVVRAEDKGEPFNQVSESLLIIYIQDINDKKPMFEQDSFAFHVIESTPVGTTVATLIADDLDRVAELKYSLVEPISARDKTGNSLNNRAAYDFSRAFMIDDRSGKVKVNEKLSYNSAAVIVLTVQAVDTDYYATKNVSLEDDDSQVARAQLTLYIEAYKADSPQFTAPWTPSDPNLVFTVKEEQPVGKILFKLTANDPLTGLPVDQFEKLETSDPYNLIDISPVTGEVISNDVLDYERITSLTFQVRARSGLPGQDRTSDANVTIKLEDINDNFPEFDNLDYSAEISEAAEPGFKVVMVRATDLDTGDFGVIRYSIDGEGADVFEIDPESGVVEVGTNSQGSTNLDREKQSEYNLKVVASDMPNGGPDRKSTAAIVRVKLLDVNDSPPVFSRSRYAAVVPENSPIGTLVTSVGATDPDLGESGQVYFTLADANLGDSKLYSIDDNTGEIFTAADFTGKGRKAPYVLIVRAIDRGLPAMFADTEVYVTVGDVSSNDGVPRFIKPVANEVATVAENSPPGTRVFQVEAVDPDDPQTANGKIVYSLPEDGTVIRRLFQLHPETGVLSTKVPLDREERSKYTLIIDISDLGTPPQQTSTILQVEVTDVDDHPPVFDRQKNSVPVEVVATEEIPVGSVIGTVKAKDDDLGENSIVEYAIIDGNHDKVFTIDSTPDNEGIIKTVERLDREDSGVYLLTIKCFRPYERQLKSDLKPYDSMMLDEIQVKIVVIDIDDNHPMFRVSNMTYGVRVNAPVYTEITTLVAEDADPTAREIKYNIMNVTYYRPSQNFYEILENDMFLLDEVTGILQTNQTYGRFGDGYFKLFVSASNSPNPEKSDIAKVVVYVLQDTELMRFVFDRDPLTVRSKIRNFAEEIGRIYPQPLKFNLYDTEFYSKRDGSLDFGRTSSCFQVIADDDVVDLKATERLLDATNNVDLQELLAKYDIVGVERCAQISSNYKIGWIEICLIVIGVLVGFLAIVAAIVVCCLYSTYKKQLHRHSPVKIIEAPVRALIPASLPPGSIHGGMGFGGTMTPRGGRGTPSIAGSDGRVLYDWQDGMNPNMDTTSYRSLPQH